MPNTGCSAQERTPFARADSAFNTPRSNPEHEDAFMARDGTTHGTGRIVAYIFLGAALFIFAAMTYKESVRKADPKPLHTPLPSAESSDGDGDGAKDAPSTP